MTDLKEGHVVSKTPALLYSQRSEKIAFLRPNLFLRPFPSSPNWVIYSNQG